MPLTIVLAEDVNAPRCTVWRGPFSKIRCEKPDHHHLAGYPHAELHAGRNRNGHWHFWEKGVTR